MNTRELLSLLLELDIKLYVDGERLRYSAPQGVMTPELQAELVNHKAEILTHLQALTFSAEQGAIVGFVPLTPNQRWFLEPNPSHPENWLLLFEVETLIPLLPEQVRLAFNALLCHHDALRARFTYSDGQWQQLIIKPDQNIPFTCIDLSTLSHTEQSNAMRAAACRLRRSLNLQNGPVLQAAYFHLGTKRPGHLLFIFHHLVSDIYSLQLLAADFQTAYRQLVQNQQVKLPPKTTSYKAWSERLLAYAQSANLYQELDYWLNLPWGQTRCVPLDWEDEGKNTISSSCTLTVSLCDNETNALLKAYPGELLPVLLTALGEMLANWTKSPSVLFTLIINGREPIFDDIDVSRTVGLFALGHPVILDLMGRQTPANKLSSVKEQLARIPNRGITHGILRLSEREDVVRKLKKLDEDTCRRKVVFNFIPPLGSELPEDAPFRPTHPVVDMSDDLGNQRDYILKCTTSIVCGQLMFNWEYSANLHQNTTIEALARFYLLALRAFIQDEILKTSQ